MLEFVLISSSDFLIFDAGSMDTHIGILLAFDLFIMGIKIMNIKMNKSESGEINSCFVSFQPTQKKIIERLKTTKFDLKMGDIFTTLPSFDGYFVTKIHYISNLHHL
jgi:hypothetical protein